jgi:hypothetical protein
LPWSFQDNLMTYVAIIAICAILLPLEWLLLVGTLKLLSGPFGFYRGSPERVAKRAKTRKRLTVGWLAVLWIATIIFFVVVASSPGS